MANADDVAGTANAVNTGNGSGEASSRPTLDLSIVMPCLDEAETLATCIEKAQRFLSESGVTGEIIIADNGSSDGSREIAHSAGARVVVVPLRGYGAALRGGIEAARGRFVIMGDADDSYDFLALQPFVDALEAGADLVMGNRFRGGIEPGAMPWLHRYVGNPALTALGRLFFRGGVGDFHCGLRAFRREAFDRMRMRSTGMEFASEMVIKSILIGLTIAEVPIILHPDGRSRPPHLRTWRDGWRHLRFMLLFSPLWLFLMPGVLFLCLGMAGFLATFGESSRIGSVEFDIHTLFASGLLGLLGYQLIVFALFTKTFAVTEGYHPRPSYFDWIYEYLRLELGLILGGLMSLVGAAFVARAILGWYEADFGGLDPRVTMRQIIPGGLLLVLGLQTIYSSFFLSILGLERD